MLKQLTRPLNTLCRSSILSATLMGFILPNASVAQHDHYDQLPDLGSKAANFLSEADAQKLGRAFIRRSRYQLDYIYDPELINYINKVGNRLLAKSAHANRNYHFYLINSNIINAFAVPGGHIALHTAILTKSESESELASVVAHEISHVTQRHIARKLESSRYDSWLALGALLAAAAAGGGQAAQAAFGVANAGIISRQLSYSRSFESEADSLGIRLLSRAGFDVRAMPRFFKRLHDESRINESHAPEFLRSHPLTINRIAESAERVRAYPQNDFVESEEFAIMQAKARAGYAENKEHARDYFKNKIDRGENTLANRYGYALALSEDNQAAKARIELDKLLQDYPNNISVRLIQADNELNDKKIERGLSLLKELYDEQTTLDNHLIDIYYANALVLTERYETAIPILRYAISCQPDEPYFHILLSRAYGETGKTMLSYFERGEYHYQQGNYEFALAQFKQARKQAKSAYNKARFDARIYDVQTEIEELKKL